MSSDLVSTVQFKGARSAVANMPDVSSGMALQVSRCHDDHMLMIFDCTPFSKNKENLIFGGVSVLRLRDIRRVDGGSWSESKHLMDFLVPVEAFFSIMRGETLQNQQILHDHESQRKLRFIIGDVLRSMILMDDTDALRNMLLSSEKVDVHSDVDFRTPQYVRDWILFYLKHEIINKVPVRLLYHEIMNYDHGLQCILKDKDSDSLSIGNIAALFCNSDTITIHIADARSIQNSEWQSVVSCLLRVMKFGVTTVIRFQFSSTVKQWKQSELFDSAYMTSGFVPNSGFEWERNARDNVLEFRVHHETASQSEVPKTFREHIGMMLEILKVGIERMARQRMEKERWEKERMEKERMEMERMERERMEKETMEIETVTTYGSIIEAIDAGLRRWYEFCGKGDEYMIESYDGETVGLFDDFCDDC